MTERRALYAIIIALGLIAGYGIAERIFERIDCEAIILRNS